MAASAATKARVLRAGQRLGMPPRGQPGPERPGRSVARHDAFALLEFSALIKECGARVEIVVHDAARLGFGTRTEFCVGGPTSNRRTEAHLRSLLPGGEVNTDYENVPDGLAFTIKGEVYPYQRAYPSMCCSPASPHRRATVRFPRLWPAWDYQPGCHTLPSPAPRPGLPASTGSMGSSASC